MTPPFAPGLRKRGQPHRREETAQAVGEPDSARHETEDASCGERISLGTGVNHFVVRGGPMGHEDYLESSEKILPLDRRGKSWAGTFWDLPVESFH